MPVFIIIAKIFASLMIFGGLLGSAFYVYVAFKSPIHGKIIQSVSGLIILALCAYGFYFVWFLL